RPPARAGRAAARRHAGRVARPPGRAGQPHDRLPRPAAAAAAAQKKSERAAEQSRPDVAPKRAEHRAAVAHVAPGRLVFVDEAAASRAMARRHARAAPGTRAIGEIPHGHWSVTTMVAAIGLTGVVAALTYPGATDADAFATFAEEVLGPQLHSGDMVVLDN